MCELGEFPYKVEFRGLGGACGVLSYVAPSGRTLGRVRVAGKVNSPSATDLYREVTGSADHSLHAAHWVGAGVNCDVKPRASGAVAGPIVGSGFTNGS